MSRKISEIKTEEILERIGRLIKNHRNEAIAAALEQSPSAVSNWKMRGSIPWPDLYIFAKKNGVDLIWLLTGETTKPNGADEEDDELMSKYESIIKHYEKIIEAQSRQIEHLTRTIGPPPQETGSPKKKHASF